MDGEKGLSVIRENKPALILLDVYMLGREGWSILTEIKADPELKDIPVCMVTQLNEEDYAKSLEQMDTSRSLSRERPCKRSAEAS